MRAERVRSGREGTGLVRAMAGERTAQVWPKEGPLLVGEGPGMVMQGQGWVQDVVVSDVAGLPGEVASMGSLLDHSHALMQGQGVGTHWCERHSAYVAASRSAFAAASRLAFSSASRFALGQLRREEGG